VPKVHSQFICQQCGYSQSRWAGKCPSCDTWNSLVETVKQVQSSRLKVQNKGKVYKLSEVKTEEKGRRGTGEAELDNILGGGLVPGMVVLVAGEPGIGKSTLLTQVATGWKGKKVLYICGEESAGQVGLRVTRLGNRKAGDVLLMESTDADEIVGKIEEEKPEMVIVDSIQTLTTSELMGTAGSVGQVRECAQRLTWQAKRLEIPMFL